MSNIFSNKPKNYESKLENIQKFSTIYNRCFTISLVIYYVEKNFNLIETYR